MDRTTKLKWRITASGSSCGGLPLLQWPAAGSGPRLCLYVHHTDAGREWAYDRQSRIGQFNNGLDDAKARGCTAVSMKDDWQTIFPPAKNSKVPTSRIQQEQRKTTEEGFSAPSASSVQPGRRTQDCRPARHRVKPLMPSRDKLAEFVQR